MLSGLLLILLSNSSWAVDIGVGIDNSEYLLVPIRFTDGFMMELSYKGWGVDKNYSSSRSINTDYSDFGVGFFGMVKAEKPIEYYYGLRINSASYKRSESGFTPNKPDTTESTLKLNPLVGVLYNFNQHLSLGLEAGYYYWSRLKTYEGSNSDTTISYSGTETRIVARVTF